MRLQKPHYQFKLRPITSKPLQPKTACLPRIAWYCIVSYSGPGKVKEQSWLQDWFGIWPRRNGYNSRFDSADMDFFLRFGTTSLLLQVLTLPVLHTLPTHHVLLKSTQEPVFQRWAKGSDIIAQGIGFKELHLHQRKKRRRKIVKQTQFQELQHQREQELLEDGCP